MAQIFTNDFLFVEICYRFFIEKILKKSCHEWHECSLMVFYSLKFVLFVARQKKL
jgi:hypothetical protein